MLSKRWGSITGKNFGDKKDVREGIRILRTMSQ